MSRNNSPNVVTKALFLAVLSSLYRVFFFTLSSSNGTDCGYRQGDRYVLCQSHKQEFFESGLAILPDLITEDEMAHIEKIYTKYMNEGSTDMQGKDFCDMSKSFGESALICLIKTMC